MGATAVITQVGAATSSDHLVMVALAAAPLFVTPTSSYGGLAQRE